MDETRNMYSFKETKSFYVLSLLKQSDIFVFRL